MATSYKTLYLNLQAEHIELMSLTRKLMTRQLDDIKEKETEAEDTTTKLQSTMASMASAISSKIKENKQALPVIPMSEEDKKVYDAALTRHNKRQAKTPGTGTANK